MILIMFKTKKLRVLSTSIKRIHVDIDKLIETLNNICSFKVVDFIQIRNMF